MSDRFKFRGKIIDGFGERSGRWVIGDLTETWDYKHLIGFRLEDHPYAEVIKREGAVKSCIEVDSKTIGQCTGLKDKNGKLIFEGDRLRHTNGSRKVDGGFIPNTEDILVDIFTIWQLNQVCEISCEIIGNIHDE